MSARVIHIPKSVLPVPTKTEDLGHGRMRWFFRDQAECVRYYDGVKHAVVCAITRLGNENCIEF